MSIAMFTKLGGSSLRSFFDDLTSESSGRSVVAIFAYSGHFATGIFEVPGW